MEGATSQAYRIYYAHPLLMGPRERWGAVVAHAASLGFSSVMLAPPFDPGPAGNVFLAHDRDRLHPALGGGDLVETLEAVTSAASKHAVRVMLDLVVDRIAATSPETSLPAARVRETPPTDPRIPPDDRSYAALDFAHPEIDRHIDLLGAWVARLVAAGIAGFRCLNAHRVPNTVWSTLMESARAGERRCAFLA